MGLAVARAVLFVCTGSISRSPFGERYLAKLASEPGIGFSCGAAGTHARGGLPASSESRAAAEDFSVDLRSHRSRRLQVEMVEQADVVVCMENVHAGVVETLILRSDAAGRPQIVVFDVVDPYGESREFHHERFVEIADSCARLLAGDFATR